MTLTAILLLVVAAGLHASWNLASKSRQPTASYFLLASLAGVVVQAPALWLAPETLRLLLTPRLGGLLLATSVAMALYYIALAGAYRAGDMSVAYPLARAAPVLLVVVVTFLLGRGHQLSLVCGAGMVLVVTGCFLVPQHRFDELHARRYLNPTCALALLAAVGTAGYSVIDDQVLRELRAAAGADTSRLALTAVYGCLEALVTALLLAAFVVVRPAGRASLRRALRTEKTYALLTGVAIHVTYLLVLVAMGFARNVSYVVAFRQLSIPLGAVIAIVFLREPPYRPKLAGVAVMLVGLVLVALR